MGRSLKKLLVFIGILFVANVILVCVGGELLPKSYSKYFVRYKRYGGGHLFSRLAEVRQVKDVDVLFIGTSHCYRGFDTRIFDAAGYSSFNLGSSIQTALQTELLLDRYLDSVRPKRVVFEVNPTIFGNDGVESAADLISNDHIDARTINMALKVNNYKVYNTLIFGLYRQWTGKEMHLKEPAAFMHDRYIPGGFVESKLTENHAAKPITRMTYAFHDNQLTAFENILAKFRARKIPYVLIQAPVTRPLYASKLNNAEVDSFLGQKGRYYNFNHLVVLNDTTDFFDRDHLSQRGVVKFNRAVIAVMQRDGFLK
jgi:hypothetical protein